MSLAAPIAVAVGLLVTPPGPADISEMKIAAAKAADRPAKARQEPQESPPAPPAPPAPEPSPSPPPEPSSSGVWGPLAECESSLQPKPVPGYYEGWLQFDPGTWDAYAPAGFPSSAELATMGQEIAVGELVLAEQGWDAWPGCAAKLGLG